MLQVAKVLWLKWLQLKIGIIAEIHHAVALGTLEPGRGAPGPRTRPGQLQEQQKRWRHHWKCGKQHKHISHSTARNKDINLNLVSLYPSSCDWTDGKQHPWGFYFQGTGAHDWKATLKHSRATSNLCKLPSRYAADGTDKFWEQLRGVLDVIFSTLSTLWDSPRTVLGRRIDSVVSGSLRVCPTILMSLSSWQNTIQSLQTWSILMQYKYPTSFAIRLFYLLIVYSV